MTTFTVRVEVRDPDGDAVSLKMSGCPLGQDVPIALQSGAATVSFIATGACASPLRFIATDARGAASETPVSFQTFRMKGAFRFVLGEGIYAHIRFKIQSEADLLVSGQVTSAITTIFDYVLVGHGTVLADAFVDRSFQLWHEAMY